MKTCDKCHSINKAIISFEINHEEFDLCQEHYQELMIFLNEKDVETKPKRKYTKRQDLKNLGNPSSVQ